MTPDAPPVPLASLNLRGIGRTVAVLWRTSPALPPPYVRVVSSVPEGDTVSISYVPAHPPTASDLPSLLLPVFVKAAAATLPARTDALADAIGVPRPSAYRFGLRGTIWASRSTTGTVSCNVQLLFLPPALLDHVLLHELCHTLHMDHSPAFHAALERADPLARVHAASLRTAVRDYIPSWLRG